MASDLSYKPKSAWEIFSTPADREKMRALAQRYIDFLSACKTERETVAWVRQKLTDAGYTENTGTRLFRDLRGKAIFAARKGSAPLCENLNLIAAHADSPRLDFKQHPFIEQANVAQAKTHYYGGIRKYQWLARPLALHGVVIRENGEKITVSIGDRPGEPVFCIADLLPHLAQKQASKKLSDAFDAEKLNIILGHEQPVKSDRKDEGEKEAIKNNILQYLHKKYAITEEDMITAEMEAVPAGPATFVGLDQSLVGGYGQDDRICVFCALEALLDTDPNAASNMAVIFWDKEEIGSDGATGASSRFFEYCMEDLGRQWQPEAHASEILLKTRAISADVTAALDPDYQEVHEKQNAAKLGYGPCFSKFTGSRGKYGASEANAEFFASLRGLFNAAQIPWQAAELGKVDLGGGGTVALFLAAQGMDVIDCGPALLSMHSPFELSSVVDLLATKQAYHAFLESRPTL